MESYIEVSWIQTILYHMLSLLLAQYTTLRPIHLYKGIIYTLIMSSCICFLWIPYHFIIYLICEGVCFMTIFQHAKKTYIWMHCFSYLQQATWYLLFMGGFHNAHWFVPITMPVLPIWLCYGFIIALLWCKWGRWVVRNTCVYQMKIFIKQHVLSVKGYLDSGNLLSKQGIPVLFIDQMYEAYFQEEDIYYIEMMGVHQRDDIVCYKTKVQIEGCKKHEVYISISKALRLPNQCQVLLNMNLMTMG